MERLKEMLEQNPCYEQHIVSIKKIYEDYLVDILCPVIYEGILSMYNKSLLIEKKYIACEKKNPNIENPGIDHIFKKILKDIPELNAHKVKKETDRIRSVSKIADIFDDLIKAVVRSNIILITYNVDSKRREIDSSKYHENVNIPEFIHNCYIQCARLFHRSPELLSSKSYKSKCDDIIKDAIHNSIKLMLPMKEILLEYLTQKYEQRDDPAQHDMRHTIKDIMREAIREELGDGIGELKNRIHGSLLEDDLFATPILDKNNDLNIRGSVLESDRFEEEVRINYPPPTNIFTSSKKKDTPPEDFVNIESLIDRNRPKQPIVEEVANNHPANNHPANNHPENNHQAIDINRQHAEPVDPAHYEDNQIIITHSSDRPHSKPPNNLGIKMIDLTNTLNTNKKTAKIFNDMIPEIKNRYNEHVENKIKNKRDHSNLSPPTIIVRHAENILSENIQPMDQQLENIQPMDQQLENIQPMDQQSEKKLNMESNRMTKLIDRLLT